MGNGIRAIWLALLLAPGIASASSGTDAGIEAGFDRNYRRLVHTVIVDFPDAMQVWANERQESAVRLSPTLPLGACRWDSDTRLACDLASGTTPKRATRYDVAVAAALKTVAGKVLPALHLSIETERPRLWAKVEGWSGGLPRIVLSAYVGTTPSAIASVLQLRIDGREQALPLPRRLPSKKFPGELERFELALPPIDGRDRMFDLALIPGLRGGDGPLPGVQNEVLVSALVRESYQLRAAACAGRATAVGSVPRRGAIALDCTPGERVQLVFSEAPDPAAQRRFAAGLPAGARIGNWSQARDVRWRELTHATRLQSPPYMAELAIDTNDHDTTFAIDETLRNAAGDAPPPETVTIRTGGPRPRLEAAHAHVLLSDAPRDTTFARLVNAAASALTLRTVAGGAEAGPLAVQAAGDQDGVEVASEPTRRALRDGGWVRWTAAPDTDRTARDRQRWQTDPTAVEFAAPAFDLLAVPGRREVLAWANEWTGDRAVARATLELLWQQDAASTPRVIASARTGDDGVALLRLPDDVIDTETDAWAGPRWWVRAAAGDRRAVLPIAPGTAENLGTAPDLRTWGVADRPLYRAGDTVRYRLWQRSEREGRLAATPAPHAVTIKLVDKLRDKVIDAWTATTDADGGLSGERVLPVHLTDSTYCVGSSDSDEEAQVQGTCFFVGTYRAQDLWVEATNEDRVLRDGEAFVVDVSAGYYSGGPAAGVGIDRVSALLTGLPLGEAYPAWRDYDFVDVFRRDAARAGIALTGTKALATRADGGGRARLSLPVRFEPDRSGTQDLPAFGRLRLAAEARPGDREGTMSNAASARYTRFARFVGLRLQPAWPDAEQPITLAGVVIDAEGRRMPDAPIEIEVQYRSGFDNNDESDDDEHAWTSIARCAITGAMPAPCAVPRERSGRYRFVARSANAASAEIERYIVAGRATSEAPAWPTIELLDAPKAAGEPIRLLVKQPKARTRALFVFARGDAILGHRVDIVDAPATPVALAVDPAWRHSVEVGVFLRQPGKQPSLPSKMPPSASLSRIPFAVRYLSLDVDLPDAAASTKPLSLNIAPIASAPGHTVRITLRNDTARPRQVALAVIDDALHALATDFATYFDPQGPFWLGAGRYRGYGVLEPASFAGWNDEPWHLWLPWPSSERMPVVPPCTDTNRCGIVADAQGALAPPTGAVDAAMAAADAAADAAAMASDIATDARGQDATPLAADETRPDFISRGEPTPFFERVYGGPFPPAPGEPAAIVDAPSPMDTPASAPLASPIPPLPSATLDRIEVTGSRLSPADAFITGSEGRKDGKPRDPSAGAASATLPLLARVRTRFADTALWQPALRLAPGATPTIDLVLPDNLTRWRAQAWSNDAGDDFDLVEATLDSGLPLEVRLQSPVRIYPGDRTRLAANVRQTGDTPATVDTSFRFESGEALASSTATLALAPRGQGSVAHDIAPQAIGSLRVIASADAGDGHDAVAATIDVATPWIEARKVQAGWLDVEPLELDVPVLPAGARDAHLAVSLRRGAAGLVDGWTRDLRDYPHRCWEQILSRAVAAALAIERGATADWPDADAVVREALENAAVFQGQAGDFHYFADDGASASAPEVVLTAYSVRALTLLQSLGHSVRAEVLDQARAFLARGDWRRRAPSAGAAASSDLDAFAAAESGALDAAQATALWRDFATRSLPARIATARALLQARQPNGEAARTALLADAPVRGGARVLQLSQRYDGWMRSNLSEQCALIDLLREASAPEDVAARRMLLAGLTDLYAGGVPSVDTQAGATCLIALRDLTARAATSPLEADLAAGDTHAALRIAPGETRADWNAPSTGIATLKLQRKPPLDAPASYVTELRYQEDATNARASAIGMAIERRYEMLRDGRWAALASGSVREGDWLRITLTVSTSAPRRFVAVTDAVPGGLRPTDLSLSGIAGLDLDKVSDTGGPSFGTRRLDPRAPKFYAESLPAGRHEIHYFARVGNAGDYLAAPAVAELMYGDASRARTASERLDFAPAAD